MMQHQGSVSPGSKINFDCIQENKIYIMSVDDINCKEELNFDPSAK
jgi:hypothetical protein